MTEKTQFSGFIFPQAVQRLVRRYGITDHRLIAYSLSNIHLQYCYQFINGKPMSDDRRN